MSGRKGVLAIEEIIIKIYRTATMLNVQLTLIQIINIIYAVTGKSHYQYVVK